MNVSTGSQAPRRSKLQEAGPTVTGLHNHPRLVFSDTKSKTSRLHASQEQTEDVYAGSFIVVMEGENVETS